MTKLTFKYDDPALIPLPATVTVTDGGGIIFIGVIADGGTFEVTAAIEGQPFVGNTITVSSLLSTATISTGCAAPIFVGDSYGYYQVVAGESQSGLPICCALEDMENEAPVIVNCPSNITTSLSSAFCTKVVTWTAPSATDNCGVQTLASDFPSGYAFPRGVTTVKYTATDRYGNSSTCSFTVTVNDITPPTISGCPGTITVNAVPTLCGANVTWVPPAASDNCTVSMASDFTPGQFFPVGTTTVTYTATDAGGNTAKREFDVVVNDVTAPVISNCPTTITVSASPSSCSANVTWTAPTVSDNCVVNMTSNRNPGTSFNVGTTVVTYTAIDASGNQAICSFNVVVNDITKPAFSNCPSNISVNTSTCSAPVTWTPPTATDICGVTVTSNFAPGAAFPVGTTAVIYTATDPSGNSQICTFNVTVRDNVAPVISNCSHGAVQEVTADNSCVAVVTWTPPTATDNCSVVLTSTHSPGDTFPLGRTDVVYTATDPSGNVSTCSFKVFVRDRTNPTLINCITSDITASATTSCDAAVTWVPPTATDNCSANLTSSHTPGHRFPIGTTTVTYTATDGAENSVSCSFKVIVTDATPPVVTGCPSNILVSLTGNACSQSVTWTAPQFTDNCSVTVTSTHSPGDIFAPGVTTVTYTGTDPAGNKSTCSFNVEVVDASAPILANCPQNITLSASGNCNAVASWTTPAFSDNCSATLVGSHTSGETFALGETTVTYSATDAAGNTTTCSFTVNVVDSSAPVIQNCPVDISTSMDPSGCGKSVTWTPPVATDDCTVTLTSNFSPGHIFPKGTTIVAYTATDNSGNVTTCSFNVTVVDETKPVSSGCPANIEVSASSDCGAIVSWTPPDFTDNCGVPLITATHSPNTTFPVGSTTVTYTATDAVGNMATCSFTVKVSDDTHPVFSNCPQDITATAGANCTAPVTWTPPVASDNCNVTVTSSALPGQAFPLGVTMISYTAMDASGNTTTCNFKITIIDDSAPIFTSCPSDIIVKAGDACSATASWTTPTTSDCSSVTMVESHASGSVFPVGTNIVAYTASDANGKSTTCTFKVIVEDKSAPVFMSCPTDVVVNATENCDAEVTWASPVASDNCAVASLSGTHVSGSRFPLGITKVVFTATDINGNSSVCDFNVTVKNVNVPVITGCPASQVVKVTYADAASVSWSEPEASVSCGSVTLTSNYPPGFAFPVGETSVQYTATDEAGNSSTCTFTVTVAYEDLAFDVTKLLTPDGDGSNDEWVVVNLDKFKENKVTVFDRWGSVIYSAEGYNNGTVVWRGENSSGTAVPTGTYFYIINVRFREDYIERKGFMEIVR